MRKVSKVKVTKADGTTYTQNAYNGYELRAVLNGKIPKRFKKRKRRYG